MFFFSFKVTKSKTWKEIASSLGIGGSSSAAYTLRKHYTKNLLAFECHYDRGGIDPIPIIQQVEAGSKKKTTKAASVPSPGESTTTSQRDNELQINDRPVSDANHKGSSNSQDSFPPPGSSSTSMDSYSAYPAGYPPPNNAGPNYNEQVQRSPSQPNPQAPPHSGTFPKNNFYFIFSIYEIEIIKGGPQYQGQQGYNQYGQMEQQPYAPQPPPAQQQPQQQYQQPQGQFPPNRYPPYGDASET